MVGQGGHGAAATLGSTDKGATVITGRTERAGVESTVRVLIVDDEVLIRHVTALALHELGCHTDEAANGQEAIEKIALSCPEVVILDLLMPVKTGYDVLDWLEDHPAGEHVHVIILSGFTAELDEFEFHPRVRAVLQKPMMLSELRRAIEVCGRLAESAYEPA